MAQTLEFYDDPAPFLAAAQEHLAADPLVSTVVSSIAQRRVMGEPASSMAGAQAEWWLVVRAVGTGDVVGAGMCTLPGLPYLLPMPQGVGAQVGRALVARGERATGANGAVGPCRELCDVVAGAYGGSVVTTMAARLYRLDSLVPPQDVPGRGRVAVEREVELLAKWRIAFSAELGDKAISGAGLTPEVRRRHTAEEVRTSIESGTAWVWEDAAGQAVCYVGARPPAFGVARVGPVYTPAEHRRHGYAGALTALASAALLERGAAEVCLYTDLANPTSNGVYSRIGYRPVTDTANLRIR